MTSITSGFNNNIIKTLQFVDKVVAIIYKKIKLRNIFQGFYGAKLQYYIIIRLIVQSMRHCLLSSCRGRCHHHCLWVLIINCQVQNR